MSVRTRLLWLGVLLPVLALSATLLATRWLFQRELVASVDRELRARAAVEGVGAFDHPEERAHLHLGSSPFAAGLNDSEPRGAFFDERGALVARDPEDADVDHGPYDIAAVADSPAFWTSADGAWRELAVGVTAPSGHRYLLRLSSSLEPTRRTVASYQTTTTLVLAVVVASLVAVWLGLARFLGRRLERLTTRLADADARENWARPPAIRDELDALELGLADAFERLRRARAAEEEFLARASHELRTPLGVMLAELDHALRRPRPPEDLREALSVARSEVSRLAALSNQLLELTALGRVRDDGVTDVDVGESIDDAVRAMRAEAERADVRLVAECGLGVRVLADPTELRQVVDNLLANAVRFAPRGSEVRLIARLDAEAAVLVVEDAGPGVAEDDRERVFEAFYRGRATPGTGTGLGLAIVRAIVERQGGDVRLDHTHKPGARFVVRWSPRPRVLTSTP